MKCLGTDLPARYVDHGHPKRQNGKSEYRCDHDVVKQRLAADCNGPGATHSGVVKAASLRGQTIPIAMLVSASATGQGRPSCSEASQSRALSLTFRTTA